MSTKSYYDGAYLDADHAIRIRERSDPDLKKKMDLFARSVLPGSKVLDFGCGTGVILAKLTGIMALHPESCGCDISTSGVSLAQKVHPTLRFFLISQGENVPEPDGSFDAVVCSDVIEHVFDTDWIFSEFNRLLRPDGVLCLTVPHHGFLKDFVLLATGRYGKHFHDPYSPHIRYYTKRTLEQVLRKHNFEVRAVRGVGRMWPLWKSMFVACGKVSG